MPSASAASSTQIPESNPHHVTARASAKSPSMAIGIVLPFRGLPNGINNNGGVERSERCAAGARVAPASSTGTAVVEDGVVEIK
jgi:hypothetical protein